MPSRYRIMFGATLAMLALVCYAATRSDADGDRTAIHAVTVDANGEDTASIPDFDGDGTIGFGDFVIFAGVFGARQGDEKYDTTHDLNDDGEIGFSDFVIFAQNFGRDAPSPVVSIPDANLRAAIETGLGKPNGAPITQADMATLDSLEANDADISDLSGLEFAVNLKWLDLSSNKITDISILEGLTNLTHLALSSNDIADLASLVANTGLGTGDTVDLTDNPLNVTSQDTHIPALQTRGVSVSFAPSPAVNIPDANLRAAIETALSKDSDATITRAEMATMDSLEASDADIDDLTGLESAVNLTYLSLNDNNITNISALGKSTNLERLWLSNNSIEDISALAKLTNLTELWLWNNQIEDISALSGLTNLTRLSLGRNNITDISALSGLINLRMLILQRNRISDLTPLAANTGLGRGSQIDVTNNPLNAASESTHIPTLQSRGVSVSFVPSPIVTIPDAKLSAAIEDALGKTRGEPITVAEMGTLAALDAPNFTNGPGILNLSGLGSASNLKRLNLRYNTISDLLPLSSLANLTYLDLTEVRGSLVQGADKHSPLDLSPLSDLANLAYLDLGQNKITDLSGLAGLANLTDLNLSSIHIIRDESNPPPSLGLSPLSDLTNLTKLVLSNNSISDLSSSLPDLTSLTNLDLSINAIKDLSPLSGLTDLTRLDLSQNKIRNVSALTGLTELREVYLSVNFISDLTPLFANAGLGNGDLVDVKSNPLDDASKKSLIPALRARGVSVSFDEVVAVTEPQIYNDNVFVLPVAENLAGGNLPLKNFAMRFYEYFNDEFDFLMFVPNLSAAQVEPAERRAIYVGVRNDVQGIGKSIFFDERWGSSMKLQGVVNFGSNSIYYIPDRGSSIVSEGPTLHELMHRWANFIVPSSAGPHWGFSSANGNIGGFDIAELVNHGVGRYSAGAISLAGSADNIKPYSPIELYLAGFVPPKEVPDLWVAEDGEWLRDDEGSIVKDDNGYPIFTASRVPTYTIEDIIAKHGPRVPDHSKAQKTFRAAVVLLIGEAYPATRETLDTVSRDVTWFSHAGPEESYRYNFYEATGGRARIKMDGLSQFRRSAGSKIAVPSSFGTPPPPVVDGWETGNIGEDSDR